MIVHAYEQWGERPFDRFRGMFAFALWDEPRRRLLLVRDRLGIKPLYYAVTPTGITFGSEIKSLLEDPDVPKDWSAEALDAYLALLYVPGPQTIYRHIRKLPAGHLLVAEDGRASFAALLGPDIHRRRRSRSREEEYLDRLDALVTEAVRIRLLSDVPLGAFLSGGIDSSTVVAAMVRAASARVLTSTVGFDDAAFSELEHARTVARYLGCEPHETMVLRTTTRELLPKLAWHFDEPFADSSAVPTYYVSSGGARTRHGGTLGGWRRRALGRLHPASRGALGGAGSSLAGTIGRISCRRMAGLAAARPQGRAIAPPSGVDAGRRVRAASTRTASSRRTRSALYHPDFTKSIAATPIRSATTSVVVYDACPSRDPLDRGAVRRRQDLSGRRHSHQGRQDEHGGFARKPACRCSITGCSSLPRPCPPASS